MKKIIFSIALVLVSNLLIAQNNSASTDEQQIRNIIAQENEGKLAVPTTDDIIAVAGPYPHPTIGKNDAVRLRIIDSLSKARSNFTYKREVVRLVVSKSGDIAYEFGNGILNFDQANNEHITGNNSYVRTWKKVNGQWMVDISFARPNK